VGDRSISVAVHVELDRLELHHARARLINQAQNREIGISRERALTGEFGQLNRHFIGPTSPGIVEADQFGLFNRPLSIKGGLGLLIRHKVVERRQVAR